MLSMAEEQKMIEFWRDFDLWSSKDPRPRQMSFDHEALSPPAQSLT